MVKFANSLPRVINIDMNSFVFHALTEADTDRFGMTLAKVLPDQTTVALCGTLGAGKTRLVQAVAAGEGYPRESVTSPTFVLCQEYHARRTIYHIDAYRIHDEDEFLELGVMEYFDSSAIIFIEWADRVEVCLPSERIQIDIAVIGEQSREITLVEYTTREPMVASKLGRLLENA